MFPSAIRPTANQAVYGAMLSSQQISTGQQLTATKLPQAAIIGGDGANTSLQISTQLDQQQPAAENLTSNASDTSSVAVSNVIINGINCSSLSTNIAPSSAVGALVFQASPADSQSISGQGDACTFQLSQAQQKWQQNLPYILPSACSLQFCCGASLADTPSGSVDAYGFPASQSVNRVGNASSPGSPATAVSSNILRLLSQGFRVLLHPNAPDLQQIACTCATRFFGHPETL